MTHTHPLYCRPATPFMPQNWLAAGLVLISSACLATGVDIHDPEIIKHRQSYYLYSTGRQGDILQGLHSDDLHHWQRIDPVFTEIPAWVREELPRCRGFWAPAVHRIGTRYCLYYSASSFGSQRSLIGMVSNTTLDPVDPNYQWVDEGRIIASYEGDDFNAIDPAVLTDADGCVWMAFGSFWDGIKMIELHPETGKPLSRTPEIISLARRLTPPNAIKAPYLIRREGYYYLFVSFDFCCRRADSTYKIMVGRSKDVTGPYLDADGVSMLKGGGTLLLDSSDRWKGPGHNSVLNDNGTWYLVHHAYDAANRGMPALHIRPLVWSEDGWPNAGDSLENVTLASEAASSEGSH